MTARILFLLSESCSSTQQSVYFSIANNATFQNSSEASAKDVDSNDTTHFAWSPYSQNCSVLSQTMTAIEMNTIKWIQLKWWHFRPKNKILNMIFSYELLTAAKGIMKHSTDTIFLYVSKLCLFGKFLIWKNTWKVCKT